jgi:hypothetical protein
MLGSQNSVKKTSFKMGGLSGIAEAIIDIDAKESNLIQLNRTYAVPASFKEANIHRLANSYGYVNSKIRNHERGDSVEMVPECPCCENLVSRVEIPLCYSTHPQDPQVDHQVFLLSSNTAMYFSFVKMAIVYLVIRVLVFDAYNLYSSINGQYCQHHQCAYTISGYNLKSAANQSSLNILDIMAFAFSIISIFYFIIFRRHVFKLIQWLDFA